MIHAELKQQVQRLASETDIVAQKGILSHIEQLAYWLKYVAEKDMFARVGFEQPVSWLDQYQSDLVVSSDTSGIFDSLVRILECTVDIEMREMLLHVLSSLSTRLLGSGLEVNVDSVIRNVEGCKNGTEEIDYALWIAACTHKLEYIEWIESYRTHPDKGIQKTVDMCLHEVMGRKNNNTRDLLINGGLSDGTMETV